MSAAALKGWVWLHKWTSLFSVLFLLVLFLSGVPLVFRAEIEAAFGYGQEQQGGVANLPLDRIIEAGLRHYPDEAVQFIVWEEDKPAAVLLSLAASAAAPPHDNHNLLVHAATADILTAEESPMQFFLDLHTELLMGPAGAAFLGVVALALILALVSGIAVYAPFVPGNRFGLVRRGGSARLRWLDLHNFLGVVTLVWVLVVGGTGMINSWGEYLVHFWRADQLADMTEAYEGRPLPDRTIPVQQALDTATDHIPGMVPWFIAMPQSLLSSAYHYTVYLRGGTPGTERLVRPVLVDAATGDVTDSRAMPGYMQVLMLSQPLHFGDYGGLPLKIIWALLSVITIIVLASGLYLWVARRLHSKDRANTDGGRGQVS